MKLRQPPTIKNRIGIILDDGTVSKSIDQGNKHMMNDDGVVDCLSFLMSKINYSIWNDYYQLT